MERTIVCLKWGDMYGAEYVNKLFGMVLRHTQKPFRFVCFTENPEGIRDEVDIQPLPTFPEPPWEYARYCSAWRKLALFDATGLGLSGRVLFLDLDIVILRSIDAFFDGEEPFKMLENWYQPGKGQASIMRFDGDAMQPLLSRYLESPKEVLDRHPTEQDYISVANPYRNNMFYAADWCASFKKHVMHKPVFAFFKGAYTIPQKASILVFHGRPNPPDAINGEWGKPMSALKRWWKGLQPCPWIEDYWLE